MSKTQQEIAAPESNDEQKFSISSEPQEKKKKEGYFTTKRITQLAAFIALALVMKLIGKALTITPTVTVTFIYIPWLLSGIVLGPISGIIVCSISDVLGNLIFAGMNAFNPLTLLSNSLYALPVALLYKSRISNDYFKTILGSLISLVVCTLGIGSFALYWSYFLINPAAGTIPPDYWVWFVSNRVWQPIVFAVNLVVLCLAIKPLQKVGIFPAYERVKSESGVPAFIVSASVLTLLFASAIVLAAVTNTGSALTYTIVPGIYLGLLAFTAVSLLLDNDKAFWNGIIAAAIALLMIACGFIIPLSAYNAFTFAPSGWFYLLAAIPVLAGIIPLKTLIRSRAAPLNKRSFASNVSGITLSGLALIFVVIMISLTIMNTV